MCKTPCPVDPARHAIAHARLRYPEGRGSIVQARAAKDVLIEDVEVADQDIRLHPRGPIVEQPGPTVEALAHLDDAAHGARCVRRLAPGVYVIVS